MEKIERLVEKKRVLDLSLQMVSMGKLPVEALDTKLSPGKDEKQAILVTDKRNVLRLPDGGNIYKREAMVEIEEFVRNGLRYFRWINKDTYWALLVGLLGLFGLILGYLIPFAATYRDKRRITRWIDELGNTVYLAKGPEGILVPLLTVSFDRTTYKFHEPLANALARSNHYVCRLTYPSNLASWREALSLEVDPKIEVILEPLNR